MDDITMKLEQYHSDRFGPGELSLMKKDCFYAGLKEHNKYLVSHMKDRDQYGPAQMLKEIREQENSHYQVNTMLKPTNHDSQSKNTTHYNRKSSSYNKSRTYAVRQANVPFHEPAQEEPDSSHDCGFDAAETYDEGYYVAVVNTVNEANQWGHCFNCSKEGHWWQECIKPLKESLRQAKEQIDHKNQSLNQDGGSQVNGDPRRRWLGHANVGPAIIDGMKTTCLINNGARVSLVTSEFVKARGLGVGSIQDLNDHNGCIPLSGLRGSVTEPLGYVVIQVQIPYLPSYDEDQVVLVVSDDSHFITWYPVVPGTPTINQAIREMKESKLENAPEAWQSDWYSHEYANYMVQMDPGDQGITMPTNTGQNPTDLDEIVFLKNKITIPAF